MDASRDLIKGALTKPHPGVVTFSREGGGGGGGDMMTEVWRFIASSRVKMASPAHCCALRNTIKVFFRI